MGTATREAAALTPRLFLGDHLSFEHIRISGDRPHQAVEALRAGRTVLLDDPWCAWHALVLLGCDWHDADLKVSRACGTDTWTKDR